MHLGVNLHAAQVKATAKFTSTDTTVVPYDGEESQEDILSNTVVLVYLNLTMKNLIHAES